MRGKHASYAHWVWRTENTFSFFAQPGPATRTKPAFQSSAGPQLYFMALDPDQNCTCWTPKANPIVFCNLILKMYKKHQSLLLGS